MKDIWDKLGVIANFLSATLIVIFTTLVTYQSSKLSNQVENFEKKIEENKMISDLVRDLSLHSDSTSVKSDFALLALERYLRNNSEDGSLAIQDREMLIGFAESLILNRNKYDTLKNKDFQYKIPRDFLIKYDTLKWQRIVTLYGVEKTKSSYPKVRITEKSLNTTQPVSQVEDSLKSSLITSILKKIVYFQYNQNVTTATVEGIQQTFKNNEWATPRYERVVGEYKNIIKYYHPEDRENAIDANRLLNNKFKIVAVTDSRYQKIVPKGQIEVWIASYN